MWIDFVLRMISSSGQRPAQINILDRTKDIMVNAVGTGMTYGTD